MLRYLTAGESHGQCLIVVVEGYPAGFPIDAQAMDHDMWRRQQGYGRGGRMAIEQDQARILSGVRWGVARRILLAWIITLPAAGVVAAGAWVILHTIGFG